MAGTLLEFEGHQKTAALLMRRAGRATADQFYVDLEDPAADRLATVFEDTIHSSEPAEVILPVGYVARDRFHRSGSRLWRDVLKDGSGARGWLPAVLIITSRRRGVRPPEAMLKVRTDDYSSRELHCVSHLAGYVHHDDLPQAGTISPAEPAASFGLRDLTPLTAAQRIVQEVTGDDLAAVMRPMRTGRFLYPDKEDLLFFVFAVELGESFQPRGTELRSYGLADLLAYRASRVLRDAARLCRSRDLGDRTWTAMAEVIALNLTLHSYGELGERLLQLAGGAPGNRISLAAGIDRLIVPHTGSGSTYTQPDIPIDGLAGWQHREFFAEMLPIYRELGVEGASERLAAIGADAAKKAAVERLRELYQDEQLMEAASFEL